MYKNFDDLYEDFFNPESDKIPDIPENDMLAILNIISNITNTNPLDEFIQDGDTPPSGPPDQVEYYFEDGYNYEKSTWYTSNGDVVQLIIQHPDDYTGMDYPQKKKEKTLQERLDEALVNEDYLLAARLRDEINK